MKEGILLWHCPDRAGIISALSACLLQYNCNIIDSNQHSTHNQCGSEFFLRIQFEVADPQANWEGVSNELERLADKYHANWNLADRSRKLKMGILVSKHTHCLSDLLYRYECGDLDVEIPFVISNHSDCEKLVRHHGVAFHHIPARSSDRKEREILELVCEKTDFLVLARYMQILSDSFLNTYAKDIINIHHSFLPSFKGADPYRQAYERGVKVIGATAHFVSEDLDEGPIIDQEITRVTHRDEIAELKRKGKYLENIALSSAIHKYIDYRVIRYREKTIVF